MSQKRMELLLEVEVEAPQLRSLEARLDVIERLLLRLLRERCAPEFRMLVLGQTLDGKEVIGMVKMVIGQYYRLAVVGELDSNGVAIPGAEPQGPCTFTPQDPTLATVNLNAAVDADGNLTGQNDELSCLVLSTGKAGTSSVLVEDATGTLGGQSNFTVGEEAAELEIQEGAPARISSLPASGTGSAATAAASASAAAPAAAAAKTRLVPRGPAVATGVK